MTKLDRTVPDPDEERELRAVSALLRGLDDPEPPDGLVERVMARVQAQERRPRLIRGAFRRVSEPAVASALAAGIGCLLLVSAFQGERPAAPGSTHLEPMQARRVGSVDVAQRRPGAGPPIGPRAVVDPQAAAFLAGSAQSAVAMPSIGQARPAFVDMAELLDRRLDHQLNALLLNPAGFYDRLERLREAEPFVARLAERAARRGDAVEIALKLRERTPDHPHTSWLVDRMLRAALVRDIER